VLLWTVGIVAVLLVLAQFVPYGRDHTNPQATNPFVWDSAATEDIARVACYDCHSDETKWWWAVKVAPFSWLAWHDITDGRRRLNFSDWSGAVNAAELARAVSGHMPPQQYLLLHPSARLSGDQKRQLVAGFVASLPANGGAASQPVPAASSAPSNDAVAIIDGRCGSCHAPDPALQFRAASAAEANALIDQMVQQGATVSDQERRVLVRSFTR